MIVFFIGDISRTGGTERVTTVIASALAKRGIDVCILSLTRGDTATFPLHPSVRLDSLHMESRSANFSDIAKWRALRRFLRQKYVDILIDVDTALSWYSIPASLGTGVKIVSWEHFHLFVNVGDILQRARRTFGRRLAARMASEVVTLTEKDRQQYQSHLTCRVPVVAIPNPITISHEARSEVNSKVVLAAGRLVPQKGFDLLLDVWYQVSSKHPDWRLRIVGSGPDETALKAQSHRLGITDSVDFVPHTSDMSFEFQSASIFAFSSRFEGFGLVLVEAKSFGLPIASFDCDCGPSDIVRDGIDGLLAPKNDVAGLTIALNRLMNDEELRTRFGQQAIADNRFNLNEITNAWERLLDRIE